MYGDNGSGKSGYARLIKAMSNARHRSEILPNVYRQAPDEASGVLHYRVGGNDRQPAFPATPRPELLKMSFYDEHCGDEYLTKESTISTTPSEAVARFRSFPPLLTQADDVVDLAARCDRRSYATSREI